MNVVVLEEAERELVEGARFYAEEADAGLALAFIAEFERSIDLLRRQPALGAPWRHATRRLPLRRFPFSIVYEALADELRVIALAHQRRRPGYWRSRP